MIIDNKSGSIHLASIEQGRNTTDVIIRCKMVCFVRLHLSTSNIAELEAKTNPTIALTIYCVTYAVSGFTDASMLGITISFLSYKEIARPIVPLIKKPIGIPKSPLDIAFFIVIKSPHIPKYFLIFGTYLLDTNSLSPFLKIISIVPV